MPIHRPLFATLALAFPLLGSAIAGVGIGAAPLPGAEVILDGSRAMLDVYSRQRQPTSKIA